MSSYGRRRTATFREWKRKVAPRIVGRSVGIVFALKFNDSQARTQLLERKRERWDGYKKQNYPSVTGVGPLLIQSVGHFLPVFLALGPNSC